MEIWDIWDTGPTIFVSAMGVGETLDCMHCAVSATKIQLMKALVWPGATYGCESWTLGKNKETHLDALEMKGLTRMLRVSWTAKKTNEWVLNKAGIKRELLDTVKARKLAYNEETRELPGERDNARNNARCTKARKATHGLDGQHQDVDRTLRGRANQNDRGQG